VIPAQGYHRVRRRFATKSGVHHIFEFDPPDGTALRRWTRAGPGPRHERGDVLPALAIRYGMAWDRTHLPPTRCHFSFRMVVDATEDSIHIQRFFRCCRKLRPLMVHRPSNQGSGRRSPRMIPYQPTPLIASAGQLALRESALRLLQVKLVILHPRNDALQNIFDRADIPTGQGPLRPAGPARRNTARSNRRVVIIIASTRARGRRTAACRRHRRPNHCGSLAAGNAAGRRTKRGCSPVTFPPATSGHACGMSHLPIATAAFLALRYGMSGRPAVGAALPWTGNLLRSCLHLP